MPTLELISPATVNAFKMVRLRALQDFPSAFGSTYEKESRFSEADWLKRAIAWTREGSIAYLTMDREEPCGIVAGFLDKEDSRRAHVASMWVAPAYRRGGLGNALINAIETWAEGLDVTELQLMVTNINRGAIQFYVHLGFAMTGVTEPYPNDPALFEYQMLKKLSRDRNVLAV
jgi:GNAT superfamily N-acetyltransferase